ncbi:Uncharacterized conserved protein [Thermostaphylospora chromogena]|uniref:Uncharacterized conserved protein n=2 Tax=Thermostaphylospora chromogena TaxID=35622 RepID=A0A1H1HEG9_9ACTN|nr:Uncharacterized conserved protein [Thermostaphylospora chromogena]
MRSIWTAAVGALVLAVAGCSGVPQGAAPSPAPSSATTSAGAESASPSGSSGDDVRMSDNVRHVANVPLEAPFDGPDAWGTDLAFQGDYAYVGNYQGFTVFDISDPTDPATVSRVVCPGPQNDVSVHGDLLFLSVDEPRDGPGCDSKAGEAWEGIRIFDISDKKRPKYVTSVATACGSHTHTMVPGDEDTLYIYVSSPGPFGETPTCKPPHNIISIVEVPLKEPEKAKVVAEPVVFERPQADGDLAGCHDITAYPEKKLAAAACFGDGVLLDISDPLQPKVLQQLTDKENFEIWHSATFNNDATKIVFSDEMGGGGAATCDSNTPRTKGANAIYDLKDNRLTLRGYFKMPREQEPNENCVAHNGSLIPVKGKDVMVQAWYQGGVSIWDFTDSSAPREIGYFERGPIQASQGPVIGGSWSAYYYNGYIYSSDITRGLDVLEIDDPLTNPAKKVKMDVFNVQTQMSYGQ